MDAAQFRDELPAVTAHLASRPPAPRFVLEIAAPPDAITAGLIARQRRSHLEPPRANTRRFRFVAGPATGSALPLRLAADQSSSGKPADRLAYVTPAGWLRQHARMRRDVSIALVASSSCEAPTGRARARRGGGARRSRLSSCFAVACTRGELSKEPGRGGSHHEGTPWHPARGVASATGPQRGEPAGPAPRSSTV